MIVCRSPGLLIIGQQAAHLGERPTAEPESEESNWKGILHASEVEHLAGEVLCMDQVEALQETKQPDLPL